MGEVKIVLSEENEEWLRDRFRKKGDLSRITNEALDAMRREEAAELDL